MAEETDVKKKGRKALRGSLTRAATAVETLMQADPVDTECLEVAYELLNSKFEELRALDNQIYELLLESATEGELENELDTSDTYQTRFTRIRIKYNKLLGQSEVAESDRRSGTNIPAVITTENTGTRSFKLPRIQLKQYNGSIKDWLGFWAQFRKVHEDSSIDDHDKIEYLIQSTVPGSRARQLVESYPAMGANYQKIIESMKSRFGREDLQIEVYVRELLKLILSNSSSETVDIANLYDRLETQLRALETLGIATDRCAAMLFPLIESCLPYDLLKAWQHSPMLGHFSENEEDASSSSPLEVRLKKLMQFLRQEVDNEQRATLAAERFGLGERLSSIKIGANKDFPRNKPIPKNSPEYPTAAGLFNSEVARCLFCEGAHDSGACFKAQKMNMIQKRDVLSKAKACFRCLKIGHHTNKCRGRLRCVVCSRSHAVLMCPNIESNKDNSKLQERNPIQGDQTLANYTATHVFLQTLLVPVKGENVTKIVRALIDTGSQRSYILKETATQLGCRPKGRMDITHSLFGGNKAAQRHDCYDITVSKGMYSYTFEVLDQPKICGEVVPIFHGPWIEELKGLGIDISDKYAGPIELLLGSDVAGSLYTGGRHELPCGFVAVETHVGWTVMGRLPTGHEVRSNIAMTTLNLLLSDASITDLWDLETLGIREPSEKQTKEEMARVAKEFFQQTVRLDEEGRYEVRLPWLEGHPPLSSNHKIAQKRLRSIIPRLENEQLQESYGQIFLDWTTEGITEQLSAPETGQVNDGFYLPHRPVVKEESATTKIRPVFDASSHEKGQPSLNHCLEKGPNLIELIPSLLLRFRENKIGIVSDIAKAFLQISVHEKDRNFLKFLWCDSSGQEITLRHKRVVFGLNSSPFLLAATLEHHLHKCREKCNGGRTVYSLQSVERLSQSFYVDNCVTSLPDENSVSTFIRDSVLLMAEANFQLRGWEYTRNSEPEALAGEPCPVLGLGWYPRGHVLTINSKFMRNDFNVEHLIVTKRQILSLTQRVFDPIGYLCPTMLTPKLLLQSLWERKLTWDQPVDDHEAQSFRTWLKDLRYLSEIKIPRWILAGDPEAQYMSIHTFCDASQKAYACAVFLRVTLRGKVGVFLLAAKARVAPIKRSSAKLTIPRLELLAATIGARLYTHVIGNLPQISNSYFWSDSSTVISWIQRREEWGVFVWNRVKEIRNSTPVQNWHHLPGKQNPADLPSRGCSPKQLFESEWWEGPKWLYEPPEYWPNFNMPSDEEEIYAERKKGIVTTLLVVRDNSAWHLDYFSKYTKTIRMMVWLFRFINNCRKPPNQRLRSEVSATEYIYAENFVLKLIQQQSFSGINDKRISSLGPFCDENGLIRMKSRVFNREDTENYRLPIILPNKHSLVSRLIMDMHVNSCHVGTQGLLSLLRERFWILGGRRSIRSVISKCTICKRYDAKPFVVESPPLPMNRVRDAVAFEVTGVDLAGPLFLKSGEKAWICLFTCAVFRAIHLELTTSLSTESFLKALRRFVSRRGRPKTIYSDNGTNFRGAENALSQLDWDSIVRETSIQRIQWRFNPPTAAWWGGFWERLIGVLKNLLRKTLGQAILDYEDLLTLVCECEAIVNARPLTYLSGDPKDAVALTPSMFLRDQVEYGLPDCDVVDTTSLNRKVRKIQTIRESLRSRFRNEYLGQLKLSSSRKGADQVNVGDLVLVGNDNSKRLDWPIAKIVEVLPGRDGQIRLVRVQTTRGQMLRPVQRLYPLECCGIPKLETSDDHLEQNDEVPEAVPDYYNHSDSETASIHQLNEDARVYGENVRVRDKVITTRSGRKSKVPVRFGILPS